MQARIKKDAKHKTLRLFFGREYNQTDWNEIPAGFEDQAAANEFLDVCLTEDTEAPIKATRGKLVIPAAPTGKHAVLDTENVVEAADLAEVPAFPPIPAETSARHGK